MILVVSLLALLVGPCLVALAGRRRSTTVFLDAFVLTAVAGMVLLHVLPEAVGRAGFWALAATAAGLLLPLLIERGMRPGGAMKAAVIAFALLGMGLHAALDGIALTAEDDHGHVLAWAVILHRIPVGVGIWWIVARTLGRRVALATLAVTAIGTWVGYSLGPEIWSAAGLRTAGFLEALLAGSLIHVVLHSDVPAPKAASERRGLQWSSLFGVGAALVVLRFVLGHDHSHDHGGAEGGHRHGAEFSLATVSEVFADLVLESAPILVLAYLFVGLAHVFLPETWVQRMNAKTTLGQAFRGVMVGLPLPVCSCGVVPIYRSLVQKGAATAAALAFLVATPELEIAAIALTVKLMGVEFAVARLAAAALLALGVGTFLGGYARSRDRGRGTEAAGAAGSDAADGESCCASTGGSGETQDPDPDQNLNAAGASPPERRSLVARLRQAVRFGWTEAVDDTLPWIILGLGIAALLSPFAESVALDALPPGLEVAIAALLGLPIYVCASGSTPIAAFMLLQGVSPGAVLAFLLTGPATNATTFGVVAEAHGRRIAWAFMGTMFVGAVGLGLLTNEVVAVAVDPTEAGAHDHDAHATGTWAWIVFSVAGLFTAGSLLRLGVRGFLRKLFKGPGRVPEGGAGGGHDDHCH